MTADAPERAVVKVQFARFAAQCRLFAPLYRQVTLTALRDVMAGKATTADRDLAYRDVRAAWADYLARDNGGRGVVLIGHSQGTGMLKRLIQEEIDGKPVQRRLVSALLIGNNILVPQGKAVGGDFKSVPLCRTAEQTGCVISYVTFRASAPPPADSRFGRAATPGMQVACTNPAALAGGKAPLDAYIPVTNIVSANARPAPPWTAANPTIATAFVRAPGLLSGECVSNAAGSYLAVTVDADPKDPRADDIGGDVMLGGAVLPDWGLHLIDMNVAMGDLVRLVGMQARAYAARR